MTEKQVLQSEEFTEALRILNNQLIPIECALHISFPHDTWNLQAIATYLRHLSSNFPDGLPYFMDCWADDNGENIVFINRLISVGGSA
jgi:hypothetical protein